MNAVERSLQQCRKRLLWCRAPVVVADCVLLAVALLLLVAAIRVGMGLAPVTVSLVAVTGSGAALSAACIVAASYRDPYKVAQIIDRRAGTRDRLVTALRLSGATEPVAAMAYQECSAYLERFTPDAFLPIRWPVRALWVLAPMLSLVALNVYHVERTSRSEAELIAQQRATASAQQLQKLAEQAEKSSSPEVQKLAKAIRESVRKVESEGDRKGAAEGAVEMAELRELAKLREMVAALANTAGSREMEALQQALEKNEGTRPAAEALASGRRKAAGEALAQFANGASREQLAAVSREMGGATEKLGANPPDGSQSQIRQQMNQVAAGGSQASDALKKLAQTLQQSGDSSSRNQQDPRSGSEGEQALRDLLAALDQMKNEPGQNSSGKDGQGEMKGLGQGESERRVAISGDGDKPSGKPGSEHDEGTTDSPFGKEQTRPPGEGVGSRIVGQMGEGESLQQLFTAAGGEGNAARRYRELFDAAQAEAEATVGQEEIPLGSRLYVRRYFDSIRPKN